MAVTRREWLAGALGAPLAAATPKSAPVATAKCPSYDGDLAGELSALFDRIGGLGRMVKGKTVTVKLNLTGSPGLRVQGRPPGVTHYTHPKLAGALAHLMGRAGARRIRFVESAWASGGPLEECMLDAGWNVRALAAAAPGVEFENTNNLGKGKAYARFQAPGGGSIYPAYDLNHVFGDTDVLVSVAKLKEHETCGVTLSMKNCFGNTPASIYGDDAGDSEPNENPGKGRYDVLHAGKRAPSASAPREIDPDSSREAGYRVPRIVADLVAARPVDLAIIDGIESIAGGEGPWIQGVRPVKPGVLLAGTNPVCTDAIAAAVMGFDPRARRGAAPFTHCDNHLLLGESLGIGSADPKRIEVAGPPVAEILFRFRPSLNS